LDHLITRPDNGSRQPIRRGNATMSTTPSHLAYAQAYGDWQRDPQAWWAAAAEGITWDKRWDRVFDPALGAYGQWFAGGMLNTCYNSLDRHVEAGRGAQRALIWDSAMTGKIVTHSYAELRDRN